MLFFPARLPLNWAFSGEIGQMEEAGWRGKGDVQGIGG
jgi:hypothetical protein